MIPEWLDRFEGVRPISGGWEVRCSSHEDRQASVSISMGDKGWLVHCHAGCDTIGLMQAVGVRPYELYYPEFRFEPGAGAAEAQEAQQRAAQFFSEAAPYRPCTKLHRFDDVAWAAWPVEASGLTLANIEWHPESGDRFDLTMRYWTNLRDGWLWTWLGTLWLATQKEKNLGWRQFTHDMNRRLWAVWIAQGCSTCPFVALPSPVPG